MYWRRFFLFMNVNISCKDRDETLWCNDIFQPPGGDIVLVTERRGRTLPDFDLDEETLACWYMRLLLSLSLFKNYLLIRMLNKERLRGNRQSWMTELWLLVQWEEQEQNRGRERHICLQESQDRIISSKLVETGPLGMQHCPVVPSHSTPTIHKWVQFKTIPKVQSAYQNIKNTQNKSTRKRKSTNVRKWETSNSSTCLSESPAVCSSAMSSAIAFVWICWFVLGTEEKGNSYGFKNNNMDRVVNKITPDTVTYTWRWAMSLSIVTSCLTCRNRPWLLSTMLSRMSKDTCCMETSVGLALTKLAI